MQREQRFIRNIHIKLIVKCGAGSRIRTDDLLITNQLLYQLSYAGIYEGKLLSFTALSRRIVYAICIRWHKTITKCAISIRVPQGATVRVLLQQAS